MGTHIVVKLSVYYKKNVPCRRTLMIFLTHGLYRSVTFNSDSAVPFNGEHVKLCALLLIGMHCLWDIREENIMVVRLSYHTFALVYFKVYKDRLYKRTMHKCSLRRKSRKSVCLLGVENWKAQKCVKV